MTLVKYNMSSPSLGGWMDDFFSNGRFPTTEWGRNGANSNAPAVNIKETADNYELQVAVPGLTRKDCKISIENSLLTVAAEKEISRDESNDSFARREFSYNSFTRTFSLPESVKQDAIFAKCENGILFITLPKAEEAKAKPARTIKIS